VLDTTEPKNILLGTLGASWGVIPEICGFLDPHNFRLFENHPKIKAKYSISRTADREKIHEIWICTTGGDRPEQSVSNLVRWWRNHHGGTALRIWIAQGTDQLASEKECLIVRELIMRATLLAHSIKAGGKLWLCLAGGRKTMSADLQRAGLVLGCDSLLHVIDDGQLPEALNSDQPETLLKPLDSADAAHILPLVVGAGTRSELLDVDLNGLGGIENWRFPLPLAQAGEPMCWNEFCGSALLCEEIDERERQGGRLLANYLGKLSRTERRENWRMLYRLPARIIDVLNKTPVEKRHLGLLKTLPKADLHRHLGGSLTLPAQRRIGRVVWDSLTVLERSKLTTMVSSLLEQHEWPWDWPDRIKRMAGGDMAQRAKLSAALLVNANMAQLQKNLFEVTEPRVGLISTPRGFPAYERPGELTGSAILGIEAALRPYAAELVDQAVGEGIAYLELRGSPTKYHSDGLTFLRSLQHELELANAKHPHAVRPRICFLVIADRRDPHLIPEVVKLAVQAREELSGFVVGLDLAGDENEGKPAAIAQGFSMAFKYCLPITVHAGEADRPENIWEATYHLHADRIGHGLTLVDNHRLLNRFRDKGVCLEICPTSNLEVVGFKDPLHAPRHQARHPMKALWNEGVALTVCTDNPGISRTTLAEEYLAAARMAEDGLTLWEALAIIKQAYINAFISAADKEDLIKRVDERIYQLISRYGEAFSPDVARIIRQNGIS
jgi:adenosine deaminase